ncbi:MAG: hypothetical protein K5707_00140, partial [Clostridia bacterium]|nr:hypothetical protein [Clostridia bacterium]
MNMKNDARTHSIRSRLFTYFLGFALIIVALIWLLQVFFLDTYYEDMKLRESDRMAKALVQEYSENHSVISLA